ncbi:response regulator transcription factor [Tranquillimonas alkanivorans]|uniref:Response regulatory domain-containing protein n=1 Tax=Tranquillimonas alkanivorans TaxID=441119 RepID=A0A1I5SFW1_9RHOB|nr:response regulator transcription factor [Tranquillimonas alkanivorans]SFP69664.1 hypothetical protein SAMN04488047_1111 [Tranquillimonas alkanivorans]
MKILVVECDPALGPAWAAALTAAGHGVTLAGSMEEGGQALLTTLYDLVVVDLDLGEHSGIPLVNLFAIRNPRRPALLMSGSRLFSRGELFRLCANISMVLPRGICPSELVAVAEHQGARAECMAPLARSLPADVQRAI